MGMLIFMMLLSCGVLLAVGALRWINRLGFGNRVGLEGCAPTEAGWVGEPVTFRPVEARPMQWWNHHRPHGMNTDGEDDE